MFHTFHTSCLRYGRVWNMSQFTEFEMPVETPKATADEIRRRFPSISADIDQLKTIYGELNVLMVDEGDQRIETKTYKIHLTYRECSVDMFIRMGKLSQANSNFVNKERHGRK